MEQIAIDNGFKLSHKCCPCMGTVYSYKKNGAEGQYELLLFTKKGVWRLMRNHYIIDKGTANVLEERLKQWD